MTQAIFYIVVVATFVFFLLTFFIVYIAVVQNKKKGYFRQELMRAQIEIREQTLKHIAFELHDNLGQIASLIKINLNTIELDSRPRALRKIEDTKDLTRQLIMDIKSLSQSLNNDRILQLGLEKGLQNEIQNLNKTGQFQATLYVDNFHELSDHNTTIILYRMAQELLNNAVKHSRAARITVSVARNENCLTLVFADDGVGFNVAEAAKLSEGLGLANLQSRASLIGAHLSIVSQPSNGTVTTIKLPL
jgi:two-component system NarL family sensor kinase